MEGKAGHVGEGNRGYTGAFAFCLRGTKAELVEWPWSHTLTHKSPNKVETTAFKVTKLALGALPKPHIG